MNRIQLRCGVLSVAALLVAGLAPVALPTALEAQSPAADELVIATVYSGGVDFLPSVRYDRAILTISGNGKVVSRELDAHESLAIGMFDSEGNLLLDGLYKWELKLVPDASTALEFRKAASSGGDADSEAWRPRSGVFTIRNGLIATPDLVEAGAAERPEARPATLAAASPMGFRRESAEDDDRAVGWRQGVEREVNARAAQSGPAPGPVAGGVSHPDMRSAERSDATALALGRSLETVVVPPVTLQPTQAAGWSGQRPRSDGANGRDRSLKDQ